MVTKNSSGTNIAVGSSNEVTQPLQPAFLAYLATTDSNVTGNGGTYTLGSGNALTEVTDQGSNFNTNGTFTAPVTGVYMLTLCSAIINNSSATSLVLSIITSNRTYQSDNDFSSVSGSIADDLATFADMDSGDTATYTIVVDGEAGDTSDAIGSSNVRNAVSGVLIA